MKIAIAWRVVAISVVALFGFARGAMAQSDYPRGPVKMLVGFAAGGGNDLLARLVAQKLAEKLGQPVVVENRPGAGSMIALEAVARAAPDGQTFAIAPYGTLVINPTVFSKVPYDPLASFTHVSIVATYPFILTVAADNPAKNLTELVALAKAAPDKANYGSSAPVMQLMTEQFKAKTGAPFEHIPIKSTGEAIQGLLNGQLTMAFIDPGPLMGPLKAGRVRALASSGSKRFPELPDVPTMPEAGVPGVEVDGFMGVIGPKGLPAAVVIRLETELVAMTKVADFQERLKTQGLVPVGSSGRDFRAVVERDLPIWKGVAQAANIKLD
jgi:tripartite-type tricarboxylate transporter receptor subunit TctC